MSNVAQYDFSLNLHKQVAHANENAFHSPISIIFTLAMCYVGSDGTTKSQLKKSMFGDQANDDNVIKSIVDAVQLKSNGPNGGFQLKSANRLYSQENYAVKTDFINQLNTKFRADILSVNFGESESVRQQINQWVSSQTNDRIKELIASGVLSALTKLVLVNALYFKAEWIHRFPKGLISDKAFHVQPSKNAVVKMMQHTKSFDYYENNDFQLLQMPYTGPNLNMIILLPKQKHGLQKVKDDLNGQKLKDALANLKSEQVEVHMPKFKIEQSFKLKETLQHLGIKDAFDGSKANFNGISDAKLYISEVVHKAFIEVTENGTEAAAATATLIAGYSLVQGNREPKIFRADHPFIFAITSGAEKHILFLGQYYGPGDK